MLMNEQQLELLNTMTIDGWMDGWTIQNDLHAVIGSTTASFSVLECAIAHNESEILP